MGKPQAAVRRGGGFFDSQCSVCNICVT